MDHIKHKKVEIFAEIKKQTDHKLPKYFYFIRISYVLVKLWLFYYLCDSFFFSKNVHFKLEQMWELRYNRGRFISPKDLILL